MEQHCRYRGRPRQSDAQQAAQPDALTRAGSRHVGLGSQALLHLFDPALERGNVLLQPCEIALEDLAPSTLVGELCLDAA